MRYRPSHRVHGWARYVLWKVPNSALPDWHCLTHFCRWDTPQHVLIDDHDEGQAQIWPGESVPQLRGQKLDICSGKDYSNPRISDFYTLNKPEEDMYDRTKVPRMPWSVDFRTPSPFVIDRLV